LFVGGAALDALAALAALAAVAAPATTGRSETRRASENGDAIAGNDGSNSLN